MAVSLQHNDLTIEVFDDPAFKKSPEYAISYDNVYQPDKDNQPVSKHAIIVLKNNVKIASAILLSSAGATSVTTDSVIIDCENLITRCCNTVFSLTLPDLQLNWMKQVDWATCFSINKYQGDYITHGELSISRIDKKGKTLWEYSGADIFVSLDGSSSFDMYEDHIMLTDFNGSRYKLDYDGKTMNYEESDYYKQNAVKVFPKSQKPWWKFW